MPRSDVLIVGAGQAGLAMSRCLSEQGIEHVVLERGQVAQRWRQDGWDSLRLLTPNWMTRLPGHHYRGDDPDGFMAVPELIRMLDDHAVASRAGRHGRGRAARRGVGRSISRRDQSRHVVRGLPAIVAAGTPAVRSTRFAYPSQVVSVAIEPRHGVDALYAPRRVLLDRVLVDAAAASGAEFLFHSKAASLARTADGRVSGIAVETPQGSVTIRADLVIGADGLHSAVARGVDASEILTGRHATAVLYSYWQGLPDTGYEWHYAANASVGKIPTNDGSHCVFVSFPAEHLAHTPGANATDKYERLLREFASLTPLMSEARRIDAVRGFGGHRGFLKRSVGPGWALVGDACYFRDPLTAHGITDALRDAELLARAALRGSHAAFTDYETTRLDLSRQLFEATDRIASFVWTEPELQSLHRAFSVEMSRETRVLASLEPLPCLSPPANAHPVA